MKRNHLSFLALCIGAVVAASSPLWAQSPTPSPTPAPVLYGLTFFGNELVRVDTSTGSATMVGSLAQSVNGYGLAARSDGRLYTFDSNTNKIREINKVSGKIVRDVSIGLTGLIGEGDLAFRSDGVGFLTSALNATSPGFTPVNDIYTFNIDSGTSQRIGTTGVTIDGLAFDPNGTLYGVGQGDATLYTINQTNGAASPVGSFGVANNSPIGAIAFGPNAVLYVSIDDRLYTVDKTTGAATAVSQTVLDFDVSSVSGLTFAPGAGSFGNMSSRVAVGTGDNVAIQGFYRPRYSRQESPTTRYRSKFDDCAGRLTRSPVLVLFNAQGIALVRNDNWRDSAQASAIAATGIGPTNDKESAILQTLTAGAYTCILSGANGTTGIGLAEIYDLDLGSGSSLANVSTRGSVQTGDKILIGGVIVSGSAPQHVVVRAIGPDLSNSNVPNPLQDPFLDIRDVNGTRIASNDNWQTSGQQAEIVADGLAPGDDRDSALIIDLSPGAYTALVTGVNNGIGNALVEFYDLSTNNQ